VQEARRRCANRHRSYKRDRAAVRLCCKQRLRPIEVQVMHWSCTILITDL